MIRKYGRLAAATSLTGLLAGCAPDARQQAAYRDPATGLPGCVSRNGLLPSSGNRIVQSANSLPVGAKDMSPSCLQRDVAQPYAAP
jgi:hypothetical protein